MKRSVPGGKFCWLALLGLLALVFLPGTTQAGFQIVGGVNEVVGDPGGTNFANPDGSIAGKGLPTQLGGWPVGPGFAPDPTFNNALGISGFTGAGLTLLLTEAATVRFTYYGSGDATLRNQFWVDPDGVGAAPAQLLFTSGVTGQGEFRDIFLQAGLIPFFYVTGTGVVIPNGLNPPIPPNMFLGINPYTVGGPFARNGFDVFAGLSDLPGPGDHDYQDLGVRLQIVPEPASLALAGSAMACLSAYGLRRRKTATA